MKYRVRATVQFKALTDADTLFKSLDISKGGVINKFEPSKAERADKIIEIDMSFDNLVNAKKVYDAIKAKISQIDTKVVDQRLLIEQCRHDSFPPKPCTIQEETDIGKASVIP